MARAAIILAAAALATLTAPVAAGAARYAAGLEPGARAEAVAAALARRGGTRVESLAPLRALTFDATSRRALTALAGVRYVERLRARRLAYVPNDPLVPRQWYLTQNRAYDAWTVFPPLAAVRVAVIDSGIDATHPELAGRIAAARSFVGSSPVDTQGHGTFVAGLIAAQADDGVGIAGLAPSARLLVAKVVGPEQSIPVEAEAKAIRWAVAHGARVINMSLGGLRDPTDPDRDTRSQLEADAVAYAVSNGVTVVAAVGNADQAPSEPWPYASWPAALPHVLGVSALARAGSSPAFSNRDETFNDIAAPGEQILSTFPLRLTARKPACLEQGYSTCGAREYSNAEGTSFAAPQVSAAAANMLATLPSLRPDQVTAIVERTAVDAVAENGCRTCGRGRDVRTGWGRLDAGGALEALAAPLPAPDSHEANDDAGARAYPLFGSRRRVDATIDYWDDRDDVYGVYLRRGQRLFVSFSGSSQTSASLSVWKPATATVGAGAQPDDRVRHSVHGTSNRIAYRAPSAGWYDLQVRIERRGAGPYRLSVVKV